METSDKLAVLEKYKKAFQNSDLNVIREIYADDALVEDPVGTDVHNGIDAVCAFYQGALQSGAKLSIDGAPCCAGTGMAYKLAIDAGGMKIDAIGIMNFNEAGQIKSMRAYWGPENIST